MASRSDHFQAGTSGIIRNPYASKPSNKPPPKDKQQELSISSSEQPLLTHLLPKLRPFQREALEFAVLGTHYARQITASTVAAGKGASCSPTTIPRGRILLADEMGLGKTVSSLAIMCFYEQEWPLLVVCPASLRYQWPCEIERFLPQLPPESVYVCAGFQDVGFLRGNVVKKGIRVVVATYSLFQRRSAVAHAIQKAEFKCVIVDESHNIKQRDSQRAELLLPVLQQCQRLVLLSGTPALARPCELWTSLHAIAPRLFGTWPSFADRYCDRKQKRVGRGRFITDTTGASNLAELHGKLRQVMVRRLKNDVLSELPPKQRTMIPVTMDAEHIGECREAMREYNSASDSKGVALMNAFQQTGIGKAAAIADYITTVWLPGCSEKILVFAHHKHVMDTLENALLRKQGASQQQHIRIDGSVGSGERHRLVRKFQTVQSVRVALLSVTAAGVGLTLTAASTVLFAELHWTPGALAQAEDRAHRIGQTASQIQILYMVNRDRSISIDSALWSMLGAKIGTVDEMIDGKSTVQQSESVATKSAQDEVSDFFASASDDKNLRKRQTPVKGTIQSLFQRLESSKKQKPLPTSQPIAPDFSRAVSATVVDCASPQVLSPSHNACSWTCNICTLDNCLRFDAGGIYSCEACGELYSPSTEASSSQEESNSAEKYDHTPLAKRVNRDNDAVIIVDDDAPSSSSSKKRSPITRQGCSEKGQLATGTCARSDVLRFTASGNTGRLTVHLINDGKVESTFVNFDMHDLLTQKSADSLLDSKVTREERSRPVVEFNAQKVDDVVRKIKSADKFRRRDRSTVYKQELEQFVSQFLSLREPDRKSFRDSGCIAGALTLTATVSKLTTSATANQTERYSGGAKERAMENQLNGSMTAQDSLVLTGEACAWCGEKLSSVSVAGDATYCSEECAVDGRVRRGGMFASARIRSTMFAIERGICALCGVDAHALFQAVVPLQPAERLNRLLSAKWKLPTTKKAMDLLLQDPKEGKWCCRESPVVS